MFRIVSGLFLSLLVYGLASAQPKAISKDMFAKAYDNALEKGREFSRVHRSTSIRFWDREETERMTWVWEYDEPDKHRLVFEQRLRGQLFRLERVNLEDKTYCKTDTGEWQVETGTCSSKLPWMITQQSYMLRPGTETMFKAEQAVMDGVKYTVFSESGTFTARPPGKQPISSLYESKFWVDDIGRIVRQKYRSRIVGTDHDSATWDDEHTYDAKVRVTAPF